MCGFLYPPAIGNREWRALMKYNSLHEVFLSKLKGCWKGRHYSVPSKIQRVGTNGKCGGAEQPQ